MDNRGEVWKTVIVLVPILSAALVAVSRIMDARHHPFDVLTGAALGSVTAWISYRQYFPSVANPKAKGRAYKPRTWGTDAIDMQSGTLATEDTDYTRAMEEGRNASSESLDSVGGTRKRSQNPMAMMHSRTFTSSPLQGESGSQEFELLPQQRVATFPMDPPTHAQPVREHDGASRSADDSEWRRSVDMGESHGRNMMDSPEGRPLGLNRLSLPPGEVPVPVRV